MSGLTPEEAGALADALLAGTSSAALAANVYYEAARIADEREARTREAIAVGIEADVCCTVYTSWCARCVAKREDAELARAGGAS